ncbi:hypothetical protein EJB05_53288, partial [Eragrostis curvula]
MAPLPLDPDDYRNINKKVELVDRLGRGKCPTSDMNPPPHEWMIGPSAMRTTLLFVTGLIAIYLITTPTTAIPVDIDNPRIQQVGSWAVMEHDNEAHDGIQFNKVVSGNEKMMGFILHYDLIIDALNNDGKDCKYEAEVHEMDGSMKRTLVAFKPAN